MDTKLTFDCCEMFVEVIFAPFRRFGWDYELKKIIIIDFKLNNASNLWLSDVKLEQNVWMPNNNIIPEKKPLISVQISLKKKTASACTVPLNKHLSICALECFWKREVQ